MSLAILTDVTRCIGCFECVAACKQLNGLKPELPRDWHQDDGLSADNWTSLVQRTSDRYVRKQCRHCLKPACVSVCPVGALHETPEGAVVYDRSKCLGCRYCMMACPYGIPRYDWDEPVPYVQKCILCYDRVKDGGQPACTEACPKEATIFGDRDKLIAEARARIKAEPDRYLDHIWGEHEAGGTSVLYISDINLDFLTMGGQPKPTALPSTTELAMKSVPYAFVGMGAVMYGVNWVIRRRMQLAQTDKEEEHDNE